MNKNTKKLIEKAGFVLDENNTPQLKLLVELVARESASQVNHVYKQGGGSWGEVILKHFNLKP